MADRRMTFTAIAAAMSVPMAVMAPGPSLADVAKRESWAAYWTRFSRAATRGDAAAIAAASAPAVRQHGPLDSDPVVRLPRANVAAVVARLIRDPAPIDATRRSLRDALAAAAPSRNSAEPLGYRRVGPLVFGQIRGQWWLTEVYVED